MFVLCTLLFLGIVPMSAQNFSNAKINKQVDSVMRKLSVREKIAQLMIVEFGSDDSKKKQAITNKLVKKEKIGGLIPMNDVLIPAMKRMNELNKMASIPMLVSIDAEWGANMRYKREIPPFPRQMQLGALSSDSLVYKLGYLIGKECLSLKMQVNYAPDVDINNNPLNPAINTRSFGEDKEKVAQYGIALMQGMKDAGVAGSAKHFPGHGDTDVDSHLALPKINFDYQRLDSLEMYPFKKLINAGVDMIMVAHLNVPALDPSGTPSSISKVIVTDLLREKLGFKGIICTDALNMDGVAKESGLEKKDIPLAAYKAGADILLMPEDVENSITVIEKALKRGEISLSGLNDRVRKVLALKARMGLFNKGYSPLVDIDGLEDRVIVKENLDLMQQIAKNSMTVMFNDNSEGFGLPVSFENKKVAFLGYRGAEFSREFANVALKYGPIDTLILSDDATLVDIKSARNNLRDYDLIITAFNDTDPRPHKGFGIDREEINFITDWAKEQPMIAVYMGSPYALTRIPDYRNFTAFVLGYSNNIANNFAAAQVVFGGIPAIGVLPVTAADFKVGHTVTLTERYREEYFNFSGTKEDSLLNVVVELDQQSSALLSVTTQVCELVASGRVKLDEVQEHLSANPTSNNLFALQQLLDNIKRHNSIKDRAEGMFKALGMRNTKFAQSVPATTSYNVPNIITTKGDMLKFKFAVKNGGKYEGKQVISEKAAVMLVELIKESK